MCLALLRLYNFDPDTVNVSLLASVLLKALTQLPELDFSLMLHLIPERFQVCTLQITFSDPRLGETLRRDIRI